MVLDIIRRKGEAMGFWIFMMFIELLIPVTMIGFGKMFLKHSPKEINMAFGYRTSMSMKNRDTWEFAHKYCGKIWYNSACFFDWFDIPH